MISNFHSLLNRPWYIEQKYAEAHLPLLLNLISGKQSFTSKVEQPLQFTKHTINSNNNSNTSTKNRGYVAVIDLKNPIYKYDQECGPRGTQSKIKVMETLKKDESIEGVVLDIDSGGGQVSGTPEFYDYIASYPKPVVSYTAGYMCSAAYYIGSAASYVYANPRAEAIGSIGAYLQFLDMTGYYEAAGAKLHTIYASKSTEKNKAYRDALEGNYDAMVKQELDPIVDDFISDVKSSMPNINTKVFKGATYNGAKALELNLVDDLGNLQDAINKVYEINENTNTNSNSNSNLNTMNTTERKQVQSVLGLDAPLATTENGSYLNDAQLDTLESHLADSATALKTAQDATKTAEAALNDAGTKEKGFKHSLKALAAHAGVAESVGSDGLFAALTKRITELSKQPGDVHTTVKKTNETDPKHAYVDFGSPIYKN